MISDIEQHFKKKKVAVLFYHGLPPVLCWTWTEAISCIFFYFQITNLSDLRMWG